MTETFMSWWQNSKMWYRRKFLTKWLSLPQKQTIVNKKLRVLKYFLFLLLQIAVSSDLDLKFNQENVFELLLNIKVYFFIWLFDPSIILISQIDSEVFSHPWKYSTKMSDDEVIGFEITEDDINNEFNFDLRRPRISKNRATYGIWAEDSDEEEENDSR